MAETLRYREVERALLAHDGRFEFDGGKGSEIMLSHPDFRDTICLSHHGGGDIIGADLLSRIVWTFGLPRNFFAPASSKAKPRAEAIVLMAFDLLLSRDSPEELWFRRASTGTVSCHLKRFRPTPGRGVGTFDYVMGAWFWLRDDQLSFQRGGRKFTSAFDWRKVSPAQLATKLLRFSRAPLPPRPRVRVSFPF